MKLITEKHLENKSNVLYLLFAEQLLTDVTLHCKDGSIKAHKLVLASCSPYFRKLLVEEHRDGKYVEIQSTRRFTLEHLNKVIELAYKGFADVSSDTANSICELIEELEMTGIKILDDEESNNEGKTNGYGRDTRVKGQKRVAVDEMVEETPSKMIHLDKGPETKSPTTEKNVAVVTKTSSDEASVTSENMADADAREEAIDLSEFLMVELTEVVEGTVPKNRAPAKLTSWDKKPRKYQCELCTSSFKTTYHLTRHLTTHSGERPYACNQCDKAFSRKDKLKHHIKKIHNVDPIIVTQQQTTESLPVAPYVSHK